MEHDTVRLATPPASRAAEPTTFSGRYGYCSRCGTHNDLQELTQTIEGIVAKTRERIKAGALLEAAVTHAVSAFDSVARQYATALFRNLKKAEELKAWFGIDLFEGLKRRTRSRLG